MFDPIIIIIETHLYNFLIIIISALKLGRGKGKEMKSVKIFGKSVPMLAIALVMIASVATVAAASAVVSNTVRVTATEEYIATLLVNGVTTPTTITVGHSIAFTGTLTATAGSNVASVPVDIYCTYYDVNGLKIGDQFLVVGTTTDTGGNFAGSYTPTNVGDYDFVAIAMPP